MSTQGSRKMDCINHQKYCQVFIPNFHPFSLIVLKCTVCLFVFFILYTGKCKLVDILANKGWGTLVTAVNQRLTIQ